MFEQIVQDARADRFASWGYSTVIDENIGQPVIERAEFEELHAAAGLNASHWPIGNAGLIHVYGYLLSRVETPYGLKRDRWESGDLARAFGLPETAFLLGDAAVAGETVLQRVTAVLLAHLEHPGESRGDILTFDDGLGDGQELLFRTVVVRAPSHSPAGSGESVVPAAASAAVSASAAPVVPGALVYGVHDGERMRAITTFPLASVSTSSLNALQHDPPRMRYNAALPPGARSTLPPRSPLLRL